MPIRMKCPECNKAFRVKDDLAGKKVACPGCKHVLAVPEGVPSEPVKAAQEAVKEAEQFELETMAAQALQEHQLKQQEAAPQFVEFICPQCDEKLKLSADLAGKQTPCPECRRIIKVPQLQKQAPKDWREAGKENVPTAVAMLKQQEQMDGAWGSVQATKVSREALVEAKVITAPKRRWTRAQKIRVGVLVGGAFLFLCASYYFINRWFAENFEARTLAEIEAYTGASSKAGSESKANKLSVEGQVALTRLLGDYLLMHAQKRKPSNQDSRAVQRASLQLLKRESNLWVRWFLVREALLGSYDTEPNLDNLAEYLQLAPSQSARLYLLRELCRERLEPIADKPDALKERVAVWKAMILRAFPSMPDASGRVVPTEQVAGLAVLAQELVRMGQKAMAIPLVDEAGRMLGNHPAVPMAYSVALVMIGRQPPPGIPTLDAQYARVEGTARLNQLREAMDLFGKRTETDSADDIELRTTLALQFLEKQPDQSRMFLEKAIDIAKRRPQAEWQRLYLCLVSLKVNGPPVAKQLANQVLSGPVLARVHYTAFLQEVQASKGPIDPAKAEDVKPHGAATSLAYFQVARRQAKADTKKTLEWARSLPREEDRPFALLGVLYAQLEQP